MKRYIVIGCILFLFESTAIAWPWDTPADELAEAWYEQECCLAKALITDPYPAGLVLGPLDPSDDNPYANLTFKDWKSMYDYNKNTRIAKHCGNAGVFFAQKKAACLKESGKEVCDQAMHSANARLEKDDIIENYGYLWQIEKAFRISKTDLKIRPIYHRAQRRIEAHICISFVAYKIYKELERQLKKLNSKLSPEKAIAIAKTIYQVKATIKGKSVAQILLINDEQKKLAQLFNFG